jgi:hypothetical protein
MSPSRRREELLPLELLAMGQAGSSLRVVADRPPTSLWQLEAVEVTFEADASPFQGTFSDSLLVEDLARWRNALRGFAPPGSCVLGGGRAAELELRVELQQGGRPGAWAVEIELRRSGDDPWPALRYLVFDVEPFTERTAALLDRLFGPE